MGHNLGGCIWDLEKEEAGILIVSTQLPFPTWDSNNGHESCEGQKVVLSL